MKDRKIKNQQLNGSAKGAEYHIRWQVTLLNGAVVNVCKNINRSKGGLHAFYTGIETNKTTYYKTIIEAVNNVDHEELNSVGSAPTLAVASYNQTENILIIQSLTADKRYDFEGVSPSQRGFIEYLLRSNHPNKAWGELKKIQKAFDDTKEAQAQTA